MTRTFLALLHFVGRGFIGWQRQAAGRQALIRLKPSGFSVSSICSASRRAAIVGTRRCTRYGRVVFYDFDEIEHLTDVTFRRIPPPPNPEAELSAEPWYGVVRNDVFPEEFATFLLGDLRLREAFLRHHADLLEPEFWQECQRRVEAGEIVDFFPYPESLRFQTG